MTTRCGNGISRRLWCLETLCLILSGCGGAVGGPSVAGGVSHFLSECDALAAAGDSLCEDGLRCIRGICTRACVFDVDSCTDLHARAACTDASSDPSEEAVCDVNCTRDSECESLTGTHLCRGGYCREEMGGNAAALQGVGGAPTSEAPAGLTSDAGAASTSSSGVGGTANSGAATAGRPPETTDPVDPSECPPPSVVCDGVCIDPVSSPVHCGAEQDCEGANAGVPCGAEQYCRSGECVPDDFVTVWRTDYEGSSALDQIALPLVADGDYDFTVAWGDGLENTITRWDDPAKIHTFPSAGMYTVTIHGRISGWQFTALEDPVLGIRYPGDAAKLLDVQHWGPLALGSTHAQFLGATNMILTAEDAVDLTETTSLRLAFADCKVLSSASSLALWNTSTITDMSEMFAGASVFDDDISEWDTSNVATMSGMFKFAGRFDGDLSRWDTSNVTDMSAMFSDADRFDGDLSGWDTSSAASMSGMFSNASMFNGDIAEWDTSHVADMSRMFASADQFTTDLATWDTSSVTDMSFMFSFADLFDGDLSGWDTSSAASMNGMFYGAGSFTGGDLSGWDTSNVVNMSEMFQNAYSFEGDLSGWDTSNVTDMHSMFSDARRFNSDISEWNTSSVTTMGGMFYNAFRFNADIAGWETSNVTDMHWMFGGASDFNADISAWDTSNVTTMAAMFTEATSFDRDLSAWNVSRVVDMTSMLQYMALSTEHYDALLQGWSEQPVQWGVNFAAGGAQYTANAAAARERLVEEHGWYISDGGPVSE